MTAAPHVIPATAPVLSRFTRDHWLRVAVWLLRLPVLVPFALMGPELVAAVRGEPDAVAHLSTSTADVLGTSAFILFVMMLAITPIHTMTGWRRHIVLRRDYGIGMFAVAATDLTLAATTTGDTFPGGVLRRVGGHSFLLVGTLATLLLIPLVLTANRAAQRWLGGYWKSLHRITYAIWGLVLLHLFLLFGFATIFLEAVAVSIPLAVLRLPVVRRWWTQSRVRGTNFRLRAGVAAGFAPLVQELAVKGSAAFVQQPLDN